MNTLNFEQMEKVKGGFSKAEACAGMAVGALASAVGSLFFPPAAGLSWVLIGAWVGSCSYDD